MMDMDISMYLYCRRKGVYWDKWWIWISLFIYIVEGKEYTEINDGYGFLYVPPGIEVKVKQKLDELKSSYSIWNKRSETYKITTISHEIYIYLYTGLPSNNETVKTTQSSKIWRFEAWCLASTYNGVFWWFSKRLSSEISQFCPTRNPNARKRSKQIVPEVSPFKG